MLRNGLEPWHLALVALICILLFGSKKLPEAARGLGKSMRILKSEARAMKTDDETTATYTAESSATYTAASTVAPSPAPEQPQPVSPLSTVPPQPSPDVA